MTELEEELIGTKLDDEEDDDDDDDDDDEEEEDKGSNAEDYGDGEEEEDNERESSTDSESDNDEERLEGSTAENVHDGIEDGRGEFNFQENTTANSEEDLNETFVHLDLIEAKDQVKKLEIKLKTAEEREHELQRNLAEMKETLSKSAKEKENELEWKMAEARTLLTERNNEITQLSRKVKEVKEEFEKIFSENTLNRSKLQGQTKQCEKLKMRLEHQENENKLLLEENEKLKQQVEALSVKITIKEAVENENPKQQSKITGSMVRRIKGKERKEKVDDAYVYPNQKRKPTDENQSKSF